VWPLRRLAPEPGAGAELDRVEMAVRDLERAELYVASALALGLADPEQQRLLEDLRGRLAAARQALLRPRIAGYALRR
jgi:hypothetical protein